MNNNILDGTRMSIAEVAARCCVHVTTVYRWRRHGVRGHRLRCICVGGRVEVREADLDAFVAAISDPPTEQDHQRDAADQAKRASQFLDMHGV